MTHTQDPYIRAAYDLMTHEDTKHLPIEWPLIVKIAGILRQRDESIRGCCAEIDALQLKLNNARAQRDAAIAAIEHYLKFPSWDNEQMLRNIVAKSKAGAA